MARFTHACHKTSRELTSQKTGSYHSGDEIFYYVGAWWCLQEDQDRGIQSNKKPFEEDKRAKVTSDSHVLALVSYYNCSQSP